jgi:hypothetical protein
MMRVMFCAFLALSGLVGCGATQEDAVSADEGSITEEARRRSCANVRCAAGTHCELRPVTCVRAPCPPQPTCVPDVNPCAAALCPVNTRCVARDGRAVCEPLAGACARDSDCRLSDNYCGGCACDALGPGERPATCSNPVQCFRQPCAGQVARCDTTTRRCEARPASGGGGGVTCGRNTCPAGQFCCNASCGICAPAGGACIQIACN